MEQQPSNEPLFELQVDYDSGTTLNEAAKWAKFIAIIFFICIGFSVLVIAFFSAAIKDAIGTMIPEMGEAAGVGGVLIGAIIIVLIIFTYITILLYKFATLVRQGIATQNQLVFNEGLRNLKNYFLINGIFALIGIVSEVIGTISNLF